MSRGRDSLELASLASSSPSRSRHSESSSTAGPPSSRRLSLEDEDPLATAAKPTNGSRHHHNRSISVSSAFDFSAPNFTLSSTNGYASLGGVSGLDPTLSNEGRSLEKQKSLTYLNGLSLVVGLIVGAGIFSSPSQVNKNAGSPGASLIVWATAGILTWTGATSYAELGGAMPLNGGAQMYLTKIFGHMTGFLYSWCSVMVLKPGGAALMAIIFGDYVLRIFVGDQVAEINPFISKGIAIGGIAVITFINCLSTKLATRSADLFMFFKFVALLSVFVLGIFGAISGRAWDGEPSREWREVNWFDGTNTNLSNLAVAVYAGLWAYDGWDNLNYVTGELIQPARDLPRVLHTSMPLVICCYLLANVSYFLVLPIAVTLSSTTIATAVGEKVLGPIGSLLLSIMVSGSCFGALNAATFTSGRLFYAASKEGYLPKIFGTLGLSSDKFPKGTYRGFTQNLFVTPCAALGLNMALTSAYVLIGSFETLLVFIGVAGYSFYFLTVLGLLILRVREPHLERPYRCWITTPIIFCCVSLFLLSRSVVAAPWTSFAVVPFLGLGAAIYVWKVRRRDIPSGMRHRDAELGGKWWQIWKNRGRG